MMLLAGWRWMVGAGKADERMNGRTNGAARCVYECDDGVVVGFGEMSSVKMTMDGMMFERVRSGWSVELS